MDTILAPTPADAANRVVDRIAAYAAEHQMLPGGDLLPGMLREALLVARPDLPLSEIPAEAERLIQAARDEAQQFEYDETPAAVAR